MGKEEKWWDGSRVVTLEDGDAEARQSRGCTTLRTCCPRFLLGNGFLYVMCTSRQYMKQVYLDSSTEANRRTSQNPKSTSQWPWLKSLL